MGGATRHRTYVRPVPLQRPAGWPQIRAWLLELTDDERLFVRRWIGRYVNRWGQVPLASSERASRAYTQRPESEDPP
jgi:hypothetical protein